MWGDLQNKFCPCENCLGTCAVIHIYTHNIYIHIYKPTAPGEGSGAGKGLKRGEKGSEGDADVFHAEGEEYMEYFCLERSKRMGERSKIMWEIGGIWWNWVPRALAKVMLCALTAWDAGGNKSTLRIEDGCSSCCCRMWMWEIRVDSGKMNAFLAGKPRQDQCWLVTWETPKMQLSGGRQNTLEPFNSCVS